MISSLTLQASSILKNHLSHYSGLNPFVWRGILVSFIESTLVGICYFLSFYFVNELHLSIAMSGLIMSFYGLGTMLGGYLGGKLSDTFSPAWTAVFGLFLQSIAYFVLIIFHSPYFLMADLFIIGVGAYAFITANYAWVLSHCTQQTQRLKALNILGSSSNLGLGLSGMLITVLTSFGFIKIFLLSSLSLFLTGLYLIKIENKDKKRIIFNREPTEEITQAITKKQMLINRKIIAYVWTCLFLVGFMIAQTSSTYSIYLEHTFPEWGVRSFGLLFTLNTIMVVVLQTPIVNLIGHKNKIAIVAIGAFLSGIGMLTLSLTFSFLFAILSCVLMTLGEILFFAVSQLICYEKSSPEKKGQSLGVYRMIYAASRTIGPAFGSLIYQNFGSNMLWCVCGLMGIIALLPSFYLYQYETKL